MIKLLFVFCFFPVALQVYAEIPVAFIYAKTGSESLIEREMKRGVEVFKSVCPEYLKDIRIDTFDHQGSIEKTMLLLEQIKTKGYPILVGLRDNEQAMFVSDYVEKNDQIFISPLATYSRVGLGKKNSFQLGANEIVQGGALAEFAKNDLKRKRILVLVNNRSVYSQSLAEGFTKSLSEKKEIILKQQFSNDKDLNLDALKKTLSDFKPDIVFVSDEVSQMAILAKYIHRIDPMIPFLAGDRFNSESVITALFKDVPKIRIYFASFWEEQKQN
ncbi:MAG: amino acid ABC transporter substrate-binding protein, partial [Chlamydiae bacterium]|nr:amino acid ABC transporter substrate-binding protein [Chlamydiota bacterium]